MITDANEYFEKGCGRCQRFDTEECSANFWRSGQLELRRICLALDLVETAKWGPPCYMHSSRNIAIIGAFRDNFRFTFMNASLLRDPNKILRPAGPNSKTPSVLFFTDTSQVLSLEAIIRDYLEKAMGHAEAGIRPEPISREVEWPVELIEALEADPELAKAFYALTAGRQKSYAFNLNQAKQPETRIRRLEKFRPKIFAGKGALER